MKVMITLPIEERDKQEIEDTYIEACEKLEAQGHQIIYDYAIESDVHKDLEDCYEIVFKQPKLRPLVDSLDSMSMSEAVYFCKDWKKSRHCRIVHEVAVQYGIGRIYE